MDEKNRIIKEQTKMEKKAGNEKKKTKIDKKKALTLKVQNGLSYADIGKIQGVTGQAVQQAIGHMLPVDSTRAYIQGRADILARVQELLLSSLTQDKLNSMSGKDIAVAFGILYDKEKVERGLHHDNPPVMVIVKGDNTTIAVGAPKHPVDDKGKEDVIEVDDLNDTGV